MYSLRTPRKFENLGDFDFFLTNYWDSEKNHQEIGATLHCFSFDSLCNHSDPQRAQTPTDAEQNQNSLQWHLFSTSGIHAQDRDSQFCTRCVASTYSGSLLRKQIHVEERKDEKFCDFSEIEDGKMTNKLQYYVRESERTLRVLHLMFVHANSPDRMSILV